jgi:hypothetical protein
MGRIFIGSVSTSNCVDSIFDGRHTFFHEDGSGAGIHSAFRFSPGAEAHRLRISNQPPHLAKQTPDSNPLNSFLEVPTGYVKRFVKAKAEQGQERLTDAATGRPSVHRVPVSDAEQTTLGPLT